MDNYHVYDYRVTTIVLSVTQKYTNFTMLIQILSQRLS